MIEEIEKLQAAGKITPDQASLLEKLTPGSHCLHDGFGPGRVDSWDVLAQRLIIDFEDKPKHAMGFRIVFRTLTPLDAEHVLARHLTDVDGIRTLANEDPVAFVGNVLRGAGGELSFVEFEGLLRGRIIKDADYKKWWDQAKKVLKGHREFIIPTRRTLPLQLRESDLSAGEQFIEDFDLARDLKEKAALLDQMRKGLDVFSDPVKELAPVLASAGEIAMKSQRLHPSSAIELMLARDALVEKVGKEVLADDAPTLAALLQVEDDHLAEGFRGLSATTARRVAAILPEAFGERWVSTALKLLDSAGPRAFGELARVLADDKSGGSEAFSAWVTRGLSQRTLGSDALAWLCRNRKGATADVFGFEVGVALLEAIDRGFSGSTRGNRALDVLERDAALIGDILKGLSTSKVKIFARRLMVTPAIDDLTRRSLLARAIKVQPVVQEMVVGAEPEPEQDEVLIVSHESYKRKQAEVDDLIQNKIPDNTKQIAIARSYGDLRENFEFKSAKEMQAVLVRRRADLEKEISSARETEFKDADASQIGIGTVASIRFEDGEREEIDVTVLGAWDSDPDRHVLSYLSEAGQALLGHKPGDVVELPDASGEGKRRGSLLSIRRWVDGRDA